jgi:hypothetical protein
MSFANDERTVELARSYGAVRLLDKTKLALILIPAIQECVKHNGAAHA